METENRDGSALTRLAAAVLSPNSLLLMSFGALVAVFGFWLIYNSTDLLFDLISFLILVGLSALMAVVIVRLIASKTAEEAIDAANEHRSRRKSMAAAIHFVWKNRQLILTLGAFLFVLSVFRGLVGLSSLMISYLELDNLQKQNSLLQTQNVAVSSQTEAALIDAIGAIDQQLLSYRYQMANIELVWSSWGSIGLPYYPYESSRVDLDDYLCEQFPEDFSCEWTDIEDQGARLVNEQLGPEGLANIVGQGIIWFAMNRTSGQSEAQWGTWNPGNDWAPRRILWTQRRATSYSNPFEQGLEEICRVHPNIAKLAPSLLFLVEEIEAAFTENFYVSHSLETPSFGQRNSLENVRVDLLAVGAALAEASRSEEFSSLDVSLGWIDPAEYDDRSEINDQLIGVLETLITAEMSLRELAERCSDVRDLIGVNISTLEKQRDGLLERLSQFDGNETSARETAIGIIIPPLPPRVDGQRTNTPLGTEQDVVIPPEVRELFD